MCPRDESMTPRPPSRERIVLAGGLVVFLGSIGFLVLSGETKIPLGGDAEAGSHVLLWSIVVSTLLALAVTGVLPPRRPVPNPLEGATRDRLRSEVGIGLGLFVLVVAIALGLHAFAPALSGAGFVLSKFVFFVLGTYALLRRYGDVPTLRAPDHVSTSWYWAGPSAVAAIYILVTTVGPISAHWTIDSAFLDPSILVYVVAFSIVSNFVTAGLAEELFFRVYLQTRLEVLYGQWGGIVLAALCFALLHLPGRLAGLYGSMGSLTLEGVTALAIVIVSNGTAGLVFGYVWARYRNFWILVAFHTGVNVVPFLVLVYQQA